MIVDDLDREDLTILPAKTDSPAFVYPNAELALPVPAQSFEPVSGRHSQIGEAPGLIQVLQRPARDPFDAAQLRQLAITSILLARVITRGLGRPNLIVGDFVDFLLKRFRSRIQAINIIPRG